MDFGKYIKELLMIHDCVILPGLGGFIANYKPAEILASQQTILPPSRIILFNQNLVHNDGLLYAHVSRMSGYGYAEVQTFAESYCKQILRDVRKELKFTLEDIGYFYRGQDNNLQFAASAESNLLIDSYGLPSLHYKEFESRRLTETRTYRADAAVLDPLAKQRKTRRIIISAAAACIAAALVLVPIRTGYFSEARMDISTGDTFNSTGTGKELVESPREPVALTMIPDQVTYHIIVGSFKDFGNARQLRSSLVEKGYQARILAGENAFYRVSAGQSEVQEDARRVLATVRSSGFDSAWMLSN